MGNPPDPSLARSTETRVIMQEVSGKQRMAIEMKWADAKVQKTWEVLGLVGEKSIPYLTIGQTRDMKIYSTAFRGGVTSSVKLFDMTMSDQDIYDYLNAR
jgi:hypothetical protein